MCLIIYPLIVLRPIFWSKCLRHHPLYQGRIISLYYTIFVLFVLQIFQWLIRSWFLHLKTICFYFFDQRTHLLLRIYFYSKRLNYWRSAHIIFKLLNMFFYFGFCTFSYFEFAFFIRIIVSCGVNNGIFSLSYSQGTQITPFFGRFLIVLEYWRFQIVLLRPFKILNFRLITLASWTFNFINLIIFILKVTFDQIFILHQMFKIISIFVLLIYLKQTRSIRLGWKIIFHNRHIFWWFLLN